MTVLTKCLDVLQHVLKFLCGLLIAVLIVPVTMQVLSRYTGIIPRYIWTEEIARFCFVWVIMIGSMLAVREGTHFDLDLIPRSANPKVERASRVFVHLMMLAVGLLFIFYGWQFVQFGWHQTSEISSLPMPYIFAAWPLAGLIMSLFIAEKLIAEFRLPEGTPE